MITRTSKWQAGLLRCVEHTGDQITTYYERRPDKRLAAAVAL